MEQQFMLISLAENIIITILYAITFILVYFFTKLTIWPYLQLKWFHLKFQKDCIFAFRPIGGYTSNMLQDFQYHRDSAYSIKQAVRKNPNVKFILHNLMEKPLLLITDPHLMQEVWQNPERYRKLKVDFTSNHILSDGIFFTDHDIWKKQRQLIAPHFHFKEISKFTPIIDIVAHRVVKKLEKYANGKTPIPIISQCMNISTQVILESFFGFDINTKRVNDKSASQEVVDLIKDSIKFSSQSVSSRIRRMIFSENCFKFPQFYNDNEKALLQRVENLKQTIRQVILIRIEKCKKTQKFENGDILDMYVKFYLDQNCKIEEIVAQSINFFFVGQDPIGTTVGLVLYYLAKYENVQDRLRLEIEKEERNIQEKKLKLQKKTSADIRREEFVENYQEKYQSYRQDIEQSVNLELVKLDYLQAVIDETLRIQPPANMIVYRVAEEDYLLDGKYPVKKGWCVNTIMQAANRNPKYYYNPEEFAPERWLGEEKENIEKNIFSPFSGGPRNCLGKHFALLEAKIIILHFIQNYKLLLNQDVQLVMNQVWVYGPINENLIKLKKI